LTAHGANSNFLPTILKRLSSLPSSKSDKASATALEESLSKSFLVSADMAHAVNPNYQTKYEDKHKPRLNEGAVLKVFAKKAVGMANVRLMQMHDMLPIPRVFFSWMRSRVAQASRSCSVLS